MLQRFLKKRKIKKYAKKLPAFLKTKYGYKNYYSKPQVDKAIKHNKISNKGNDSITVHCYAYAMYCSGEEFQRTYDKAGESCDYDAMRSEISELVFNGASDFSFSSLLSESSYSDSNSTSSGSSSSSFDGGGDSGGGD